MTQGDKYEYNTQYREQYILEVKSYNDKSIKFKAMYKHPEDGDSFNLDIPQDILRKMIKRNNIRLITE
jgi:hypothetical protein|tara:strand:+ start:43 stop:246 length:204 start_codon:yes stop_codon:yes gene_type:complete